MSKHCSSCGEPLSDDAKFCRSCGAPTPMPPSKESQPVPLDSAASQFAGTHGASASAQAPQPVTAPQVAGATGAPHFDVRAYLLSMSTTQKLVAGGGMAALISFFLPQYPYGGNGFTMGGLYLFRLLAGAAILTLVYLYQKETDTQKRHMLAAGQLLAAAVFSGEILVVLMGGTGAGQLIMTAGFIVAAVGAFLEIVRLGEESLHG